MPSEGRYEAKYVLPLSMREHVLEVAAPYVRPDPHAVLMDDGTTGYLVHSLYFDTPGLQDYEERLQRKEVRNRLRIRTYGNPGDRAPVYLENKRKLEDKVVKSRARLPCDADQFCANQVAWPWQKWLDGVAKRQQWAARNFDKLAKQRVPVSNVHYRRDVYIAVVGDPSTRMTIDRDITAATSPEPWELYAPPTVDLMPREFIVLELKFEGTAPGWVREVRRILKLGQESVSKFGMSLAYGQRGAPEQDLRMVIPHTVQSTSRVESQRLKRGAG